MAGLPADVWAHVLEGAGPGIFALSVSSQQMRRLLHRDMFDATWIQVIRRVSRRNFAPRGILIARADTLDIGTRYALREELRGFFAARAHRVPDPVWQWLDANAPRAVARDILGFAVARDGTLAVLTEQRLELRRGGAVVGALPNSGTLRFLQAAGSRFLVSTAARQTYVLSAADASVLASADAAYLAVGGDWVRVVADGAPDPDGAPLLNLETGAALTAAQAGAAKFTASADDAVLLIADKWESATLREHDAQTGLLAHHWANPFPSLRRTFVRGRIAYNLARTDRGSLYTLQSVDLDRFVPAGTMALNQSAVFFADDRTVVNYNQQLEVYTDGVKSHVDLGHDVYKVHAHGRRLWYTRSHAEGSDSAGVTLPQVDLLQVDL